MSNETHETDFQTCLPADLAVSVGRSRSAVSRIMGLEEMNSHHAPSTNQATKTIINSSVNRGCSQRTKFGILDKSFGTRGKVMTAITSDNNRINSLVLQADGKILAGGYAEDNNKTKFALARYLANGALDTTFGTDISGIVMTAIGNGRYDFINSLVLQDGNILAGGYAEDNSKYKFALARYLANGALDTTFGRDISGIVITSIGNGTYDFINSLVLQADGNILAGGSAEDNNKFNFALARYSATNGTLDTTFGTDISGIVMTSIGNGTDDYISSLVLQADGKILAGGVAEDNNKLKFALARYSDTNGTLDTTFGNGGKVITSIGNGTDDGITSLVLQDGKILAGGYAKDNNKYKFALARYLANGTLDTSFGNGGKVITSIGNGINDGILSLVLQADGNILVGGFAKDNNNKFKFALARYSRNGRLDTRFGTRGIVMTSIGNGTNDVIQSLVLQNGKILAGGYAQDNSKYNFALARYII